jgi:mitochondrial fission protein ELM1
VLDRCPRVCFRGEEPQRVARPTRPAGAFGDRGSREETLQASVVERTPRVWMLVGEKQGDNAQLRVVAGALGWPVEERRIAMQPAWVRGKPRVRPSLEHIDPARSDRLEPPWPDLLIAIGRRLSMVALWVREQSGGRTRIVLFGKPRRLRRRFDLIVASAQYRVGRGPNVLHAGLPLMRVDPAAVTAAADAWRARLAHLPRPLTALLVGGPTKPVRFDAAVARGLAVQAAGLAAEAGGSLYVTTSRRTPAEVVDALAAGLPAGTPLYRWVPDAAENPYLALLGLADRFVVTSDSITMMVEVARLGRPLAIFALPPAPGRWGRRLLRGRDLEAVPRLLIEQGVAVRLGAPFRAPDGPPVDELARVVERIRALLRPSGAAGDAADTAV